MEYSKITAEQIAAAKEKYGDDNVKIVSIPLDDAGTEDLEVLARVPTRFILGEFEKWSDRDPNKAKEILLKACLLSHKDEVLANDTLFFSAVNGIASLIPVRKSVVKNC